MSGLLLLREKNIFKKYICLHNNFFSVYLYASYDQMFQSKVLRMWFK